MSGLAFATDLAIVLLLAVLTTLTGRLHIALLGPRWLRSWGPLETVMSSLVGTAWWTVLLTTLSTRGWRVPAATGLILVAHGFALGLVFWRRRAGVLRPRGAARWKILLVPATAAALVGLLPVLREGSFATANDTLTYCSFAQWLQDHSFGAPISWHADEPMAFYPALYQGARMPLTAAFLLAGTQAIAQVSSPLVAYPALSTFGLLLAVTALLAVGRGVLRWPTRRLAGLGLVIAVLPQPLVWAHHSGFLAQTLGTPALLAVILMLARCRPPRRWRPAEAALLGLLTAWLASVYLALLPVAAGAAIGWLLPTAGYRPAARRARSLVLSLGVFTGVALALLYGQGLGVSRGLSFLERARVGFHLDLSSVQFAELAFGVRLWTSAPLAPFGESIRAAHLWLAPLYAAMALLGAYRLARMPRARGLCAAALVVGLGIAYYALLAHDPWTGERGHTWNLFKLAQWASPLLLLAVLNGLLALADYSGMRRVVPWLVVVPVGLVPLQWELAGSMDRNLEALAGPRPLDRWSELEHAFSRLPRGALFAVDRIPDTSQQMPFYLGLLAYPRRLAGDWTGSLWISPDPERRFEELWDRLAKAPSRSDPEPVLPIVTGLRGYVTDAVQRIEGRIGLLRDGAKPQVLAILTPSDDLPGPGGCVWLGRARTHALLFSPRNVSAVLEMDAVPGPGARGLGPRLIVDTPAAAFEVPIEQFRHLRIPIRLQRGINRTEIRFPDLDRNQADRRRLCVARFRLGSVVVDPGSSPGVASGK